MSGDQSCKLLVRNLSYDTTDEDLKKYYEKWGTVEDCKIMRNKETKKSRGFGIIRYVKALEVDDAMGSRPHELDGRTLEPHRGSPREYSSKPESHHTCNEIFVGGWKPEIEEEDLRDYFGQYGTIEEITIPKDKKDETKFRGFAVIKFDDYDPVDVTCYKRFHTIKNVKLQITKWINRKDMNELNRKYGRREGEGRNRGGGMSNGGGNTGDLQRALLEQLLVKTLGGGYESKGLGGAMRGKGRGGKKPYGGKGGQWM